MTPTDPSPDERRQRPRTSVAVELRLHAPEYHFVLLSRTVDLSPHGAFVRSNRSLPIGAHVTIQFQRGEDRNPLSLQASVVRVGSIDGGRSTGIAIAFESVSPLDESLLNDIIARART